MGSPSRIQNVLLTTGAVVGSLCLLAALAGVLFGIKPLMFKSGSMEPTISTGGLALSIPVDGDEIRVGDIVSTENAAGVRITHRVAAVEPADGYTSLTLKGDANDVVDAEAYAVAEVDRVFWSAPVLGYIVAWFSSPVALFLGGLLTAYLLYLAFGPRSRQNAQGGGGSGTPAAGSGRRAQRRKRHAARMAVPSASMGLILTAGALPVGGPAWAQFTDSASATSPVVAGQLSTPHQPSCVVDDGLLQDEIVLSWSYLGTVPATGYALTVGGTSRTATAPSIVLPAVDASVSIRASYGNWRSPQPLNVFVDYSPGLAGLGASVTCAVVS